MQRIHERAYNDYKRQHEKGMEKYGVPVHRSGLNMAEMNAYAREEITDLHVYLLRQDEQLKELKETLTEARKALTNNQLGTGIRLVKRAEDMVNGDF